MSEAAGGESVIRNFVPKGMGLMLVSRGKFGSRSSEPQARFFFNLGILGSLMSKEYENANFK